MFVVFVEENHEKLTSLYCLPKFNKRLNELCFIANSSSRTTAELSTISPSCLTTIETML